MKVETFHVPEEVNLGEVYLYPDDYVFMIQDDNLCDPIVVHVSPSDRFKTARYLRQLADSLDIAESLSL